MRAHHLPLINREHIAKGAEQSGISGRASHWNFETGHVRQITTTCDSDHRTEKSSYGTKEARCSPGQICSEGGIAMNLSAYIVIWAALALVVLGLAIYRNLLGIREGTLHVSGGGASMVAQQIKGFRKEETIERWGERLTVLVVAYGLVLAIIYLYHLSEYGTRVMR
jgi:hypothetical protein